MGQVEDKIVEAIVKIVDMEGLSLFEITKIFSDKLGNHLKLVSLRGTERRNLQDGTERN